LKKKNVKNDRTKKKRKKGLLRGGSAAGKKKKKEGKNKDLSPVGWLRGQGK